MFKALDKTTQDEIINNLSAPIASLGNELTNIGSETLSASNNLGLAVKGISEVSGQVDQLKTSLGTLASSSDLLIGKTTATINNLYSGLNNVGTALDTQIIPGASKLYDGANELNSNSNAIVSGAENLANGTSTLNTSVPALTSGIGQIAEGSNALTEGLNTLSQNNDSLKSGISTINSASKSISDGASKLYYGSLELGDGANKLKEGSSTLKDSLKEGANTISNTKLSDESKEMFAAPVEGIESVNSHIANNGSAMSAYMMSVALWVGCLALGILFPAERDLEKGKENPKAFWPKKVLKLFTIAVSEAIVMITALILINGLEPAYIGKTYIFAICVALVFMAIVYLMNLILGKVGSFLLLIFMILQLSGSAGTYPIELSAPFFNSIHKYMPFTYTVDGFRNGLSTGLSIVPQITVLLTIGAIFSILAITVVIRKSKSNKTSLSDLIEKAL